ncbi:DUF5711 family protein [Parablautia muri]|uniref:Uncharacterized protein n=1 Tax=Parablautia muri TaxID=2320879 RepID=A0A9X5GRC9_9FIRM|nr:DUF5711 family protein [Parablautia muri]NBJ91930.1 hypothetical protein [Parablautia muri]
MANIRDYLKEKEKRQKTEKKIDYKEKIRSHKLAIFYRIVLTVALVVAAVAFLIIQWKNKVYTQSTITSSFPVIIVQGATAKALGGNILLYSKDGASCMDAKGNAVWNRTYEMQTPLISICDEMTAIGDYNGRAIYVMDKNGERGTINTNLPIRDFCVSGSGVVAAVLDDVDITRIYVYNGNENTDVPIVYGKATMDKSGYPVSISLAPNGNLMAVSYLYVDSGNMKSSVAFYNFGEVGKNETDNYVSGFDYLDTIVPYVQFMDNDSAFAVSDDRIVFFSGAERPVNIASDFLEDEVQSIYYNENYVGLVFHNQSGESAYRLEVYNESGGKVHSQLFDIEYTDIVFNKDQIIIYNDLDCQIFGMNGVEKFAGNFEKNTSLVIPTSSAYRYVVVTSDSIDTIELK